MMEETIFDNIQREVEKQFLHSPTTPTVILRIADQIKRRILDTNEALSSEDLHLHTTHLRGIVNIDIHVDTKDGFKILWLGSLGLPMKFTPITCT